MKLNKWDNEVIHLLKRFRFIAQKDLVYFLAKKTSQVPKVKNALKKLKDNQIVGFKVTNLLSANQHICWLTKTGCEYAGITFLEPETAYFKHTFYTANKLCELGRELNADEIASERIYKNNEMMKRFYYETIYPDGMIRKNIYKTLTLEITEIDDWEQIMIETELCVHYLTYPYKIKSENANIDFLIDNIAFKESRYFKVINLKIIENIVEIEILFYEDYAVEIELTQKRKSRYENKLNILRDDHDFIFYYIPESKSSIVKLLEQELGLFTTKFEIRTFKDKIIVL